jgi:hypothetical protein
MRLDVDSFRIDLVSNNNALIVGEEFNELQTTRVSSRSAYSSSAQTPTYRRFSRASASHYASVFENRRLSDAIPKEERVRTQLLSPPGSLKSTFYAS